MMSEGTANAIVKLVATHPEELLDALLKAREAEHPELRDSARVRAAVLAFHELRAGREPIVATPGSSQPGLRFPSDESLTFTAFAAAGISESATLGARFAVGAPTASAAFVWMAKELRATRESDAAELQRVGRRVETILHLLHRRPTTTLEDMDILPSEERTQILAHVAGESIDLGDFHLLEEFLRRAREKPSRTAIVDGVATVSYETLAGRAHSYARALAERGVARGDIVGIAVPRSIESVAAILGSFWVGAAYVPLDPDYPAARLESMVTDTQAKVVLASTAFPWLPPTTARISPVDIATQGNDWSSHPVVHGELAYIIYTSGSTGRPKGVRVTHRNVGKDVRGMQRVCGLGEDETFQSIFSLAFDVSITELFFPLVLGGTTHVVPQGDVLDGARMRAHFERNRPTVALVPRVLWEGLFEAGYAGHPGLRAWTGGEQMRKPMALRARALVRDLYNCYGPTETTISATTHRFSNEDEEPVPIGRPLPNTTTLVLDARQRLQPFGFAGELYIGGDGVSEGYHGLSELTREKFPTLDINGTPRRFYRTGDYVRMRSTGELEFAGRRDEQVKLRGYRIELGEVATALRGAPGIRDAIALVHEDALVAYVIVESEGAKASDFAAIRGHLARVLPRFMLPTTYIALTNFPVTVNRKIDVDKLPKPGRPTEVKAPGVDADALRTLARTSLGLPELQDTDDFRDLGATSLSLVRLAGALRKRGWKISVADLYEKPTLLQLKDLAPAAAPPAPLANAAPMPEGPRTRDSVRPAPPAPSARAAASSVRAPAPPGSLASTAPLHVHVGTAPFRWRITRSLAFPLLRTIINHPHAASVNALRFNFAKSPDIQRLREVWSSLGEDVPVLRARIDLGPEPGVIVESEAQLPFAIWDERDLNDVGFEWRVREVERARKARGVDLKAWPYHALDVVLGPEGRSAVILSNASFLLDLETLESLVRELWARYEAGVPAADRRPAPGPQPTPFEDEDDGPIVGQVEEIYRAMLKGIKRPTRLPFDALGASLEGTAASLSVLKVYLHTLKTLVRSDEVRRLVDLGSTEEEKKKVSLSGVGRAIVGLSAGAPTVAYSFFGSDLRAAIRARARELRVAEHAIMMSALGVLVASWTGQPDVLVRMLIANRDVDATGVAGRRTRDVPIRLDLSSEATLGVLVTTTHDWITGVLENQNTSRAAYLRALPFPEPFTHVVYIAGEAPAPGPTPPSLGLTGFAADELMDGIFGASVAWEQGEVAFHWDSMLIRDETARTRLREYVDLVRSFAESPLDTALRTLRR